MSAAVDGFDEFLADIQPFFYRRSLTYVDVGAYQGQMLERLIASKLKVREAHLIEPNPASLQAARRRLVPLFKGNSLNFHALALGARTGRVRMTAAKTMTRVLAGDDDAGSDIDTDDNVFEADCSTLDAMAHRFTDGRISLLKIDVEGHEDRVLGGAAALLGGQQVDVVYIEAGMNPQGTQQCYYRRVEDLLTAHGYRLFKIYEQQFEWMDDSPLLRRVNMAFMSASFAERNPYRLTLELNRLHDDLAEAQQELDQAQQRRQADAQQLASLELQGASTRSRLETRLAESAREVDAAQSRLRAALAQLAQSSAAQAELEAGVQSRLDIERRAAQARLDGERQAAQAQLATLQQQTSRQLAAAQARQRDDAQMMTELGRIHAHLRAECEALRAAQARASANQATLARRLSRHEQQRQQAEQTLREVFGALSELQRRHLGQQAEAAGWWVELERLKRSRKLQLATLVARHARTLRGWLQLPLALWRASRDLTPPVAVSVDHLPGNAVSLKADKPQVSLALSARAQTVLLPKAKQACEVWLQAFPSDPGQTVVMGWLARPSGSAPFDAIDIELEGGKVCRLDAGVPLSMPLRAGPARCWLRVPAGQPGLRLELRRLRGELAVVKLELRAPAALPAPALTSLEPAGPAAAPAPVPSPPAPAHPFSSEALEMKLWGGYAPYALQALEQRKLDPSVSPAEREHAAWYLIRWHMVEGDVQRALENAEFTRGLVPKPHRRLPLAEAQCLVQLGRPDDADACLQRAMLTWPERQREFQLYRSTVIRRLELARGTPLARAEALQLEALNVIYQRAGMSLLRKRDETAPLELSNIVSLAEPKQADQGRKVSVVIPLFNAETSIASVIDSLLRQTWRNLEVIVVDDCSSDAGCEVVDRIAAADARVRLVRKAVNEGAYATRNAGARLATGHFITVHDSDDWSHPQKIETQIAWLDAAPTAVAVTSHWVRMGEHLEVVGPWVPKGSLYDVNFSSLLFERRLLETTGLWDPVKISGDAEFVYRLRALYGDNAIAKVPSSFLLSLSMVREDSLTRAKATHLRSLFYGLRWNYRDAYLAWQREHEPGRDAHPVDARSGRRRFPLPMGMRPGRAGRQAFDVVVVADFAEPGEALHSALACLRAAAGAGQRAAAFHWRAYERPARTPLQPAFYAACQDHGIEIASPGDELDTARLLVCEPALLQHRIHPAPAIQAAQVVVIVAAPPAPAAAPGLQPFDPRVAREHLAAMFGSEGVWVPQSELVRQAMQAHGQYPAPAAQHWLPLVQIEADSAVRWRGDQGSPPVIGRHGSPSPSMWPTDAARLRHSHGVDAGWPLRVLGDTGPADALLGERPAHWWRLSELIDTPSFLADLDFYLHYPAEQPPPLVTQGLLEALAAGLPVLLPPSFEPVLGPAAAYAEPDQVTTLVDALWSSQARYEAQAQAGREFARRHGDRARFVERLQALADAPAAAPA